MKLFKFFSLVSLLFFFQSVNAVKHVQNGPIHEAFLPGIGNDLVLQAAPTAPPNPIHERTPPPIDSEMIWIPGYFKWDKTHGDFVWVCGIWRKPPPGHHWIEGYWKEFDQGWAWVTGLWSTVAEKNITYIKTPPPDQYDENVGQPPSSDNFWASGYWNYQKGSDKYLWVGGRWEIFQRNYVLVPAHYHWRPEGYVFVPAFWDWPIEKAGKAYCAIRSPSADFIPTVVLDYEAIIGHYFVYYPYYICHFWHHFHFHPWFWDNWCCTPPWWGWNDWWALPHWGHWGVWWWWSHPGFPVPFWFDPHIAMWMNGPGPGIFPWFNNMFFPVLLTPNGITLLSSLLDAINHVLNNSLPLLPANIALLDQVLERAQPQPTGPANILPGDQKGEQPPKPWIDQALNPPLSSESMIIPPLPARPIQQLPPPQIQQAPPPPPSYEPPQYTPPPQQYQPPQYTPPPQYRPHPQPRPRPPQHHHTPQFHPPQFQPPQYHPPQNQTPQYEPPGDYHEPSEQYTPPTTTPPPNQGPIRIVPPQIQINPDVHIQRTPRFRRMRPQQQPPQETPQTEVY